MLLLIDKLSKRVAVTRLIRWKKAKIKTVRKIVKTTIKTTIRKEIRKEIRRTKIRAIKKDENKNEKLSYNRDNKKEAKWWLLI